MATMRAVTRDDYGPADVLELREVSRPRPAKGAVLIRVRASSVNHADWLMLNGTPRLMRLAFGVFRPRKPILGVDVAGHVEAVGAGVTRFRPGDAVFGESMQTFADFVTAPENQLAHKPEALSFEQAASLPVAGTTALQGMRDAAGAKPGKHVLIVGAGGGVGTFAIQIAKVLGAEVTAVCQGDKAELVRSLGADHVIDYRRQSFTDREAVYDAIFDLVGSTPLSACRAALTATGVYVSSASRLARIAHVALLSIVSRRFTVFAAKPKADDLAELARLVEAGEVRPVLSDRYDLSEVPEALRRQGAGHARGKSTVVL